MPTGLEAIAGVTVAQNDAISVDLLAIVKQRIAFVARTIPEFADPDGELAGEASASAATHACGDTLSLIRLANVWDPNQPGPRQAHHDAPLIHKSRSAS